MNKYETITKIAREQMGIRTLDARKSDRLDFHEVAVWSIEKALGAAYDAGREKALSAYDAREELLAAAEALLAAKDNQMETITEWRALRRAVRHARKTK